MGYDLFVRAERSHETRAAIANVAPVLEAAGLRRNGTQWLDDRIELYLASVTMGLEGGDAVDGDGITFNEIQLHPRPFDLRALSLATSLADRLGWEIVDPQVGQHLRDRGVSTS